MSSLADSIIDSVERIIADAEAATRPLEVDPYRGRLFELFVTAEGAGLVQDGANPDLSSDGLCRQLSLRWGLADAARSSTQTGAKLPEVQLQRMRLLWSVMRMWMEWSYAWERWAEFHTPEVAATYAPSEEST